MPILTGDELAARESGIAMLPCFAAATAAYPDLQHTFDPRSFSNPTHWRTISHVLPLGLVSSANTGVDLDICYRIMPSNPAELGIITETSLLKKSEHALAARTLAVAAVILLRLPTASRKRVLTAPNSCPTM